MHPTERVELTNLCMIVDGKRVLVEERKNRSWPGVTFPGGHVEYREPFTDAVIREVREETGLTISSPRLCGIKDWDNGETRYMVLLYRADRFSGEIRDSEEGRVFWTELDTLTELPLAEGMRELLRVFLEEDLSEFFYDRTGGGWEIVLK